jgi:hypothetical protein
VANASYRNHGHHAEAIEIIFDRTQTSYRTLMADPDRPPSRPAWLTLEEAAQVLETTREGVRSRAKRGTLQSLRGDDGIFRVLVDPASPPRRSPGRPSDRPSRGMAGRSRPALPPANPWR